MLKRIDFNGKPLVGATVTTRGVDDRVLHTYETDIDGTIEGMLESHAVVVDHPDLPELRLTFGRFVTIHFDKRCAHKIGRSYTCNLLQSHDFHQRGSSVYRHDFV